MQTPPQARILIAAIQALESNGLQGLTVRGIAEAAGVNIAAISYYYGGKDKLIEATLAATLDQAFEENLRDFDAQVQSGAGTRQALVTLLDETLAGALRYPNITRAHLARAAQTGHDDLARRTRVFLQALAQRIRPSVGDPTELRLAQLWGGVLLLGAAPDLTAPVAGLDLRIEADRQRWVQALIQAHLPEL